MKVYFMMILKYLFGVIDLDIFSYILGQTKFM
jgi:hypothetical protein